MKVLGQSDNMEDELLSCCVVKNGTKVVAGSQGGNLNIWNYGDWIDSNDRFRSPVERRRDGESERRHRFNWEFRRAHSRHNGVSKPNVSLVGEHGEYSIERMRLTADLNTLASASHDHTVKIWDVSFLHEEDAKGDGGEDAMDADNNREDSDMDESDSEDREKSRNKRRKRAKGRTGGYPDAATCTPTRRKKPLNSSTGCERSRRGRSSRLILAVL